MSTQTTESEDNYNITNEEISSAFEAWNNNSVDYNSLKETIHPVLVMNILNIYLSNMMF
jgi:hypothetical protein